MSNTPIFRRLLCTISNASTNPVGAITEWAVSIRGALNYHDAFEEKTIRHGEQWEIVIKDKITGKSFSGGVCTNKKSSRFNAAKGLHEKVCAISNPSTNPVGALTEWAVTTRGVLNYHEAFEEETIRHGEQKWEIVIKDKSTGNSSSGGVFPNKKLSRFNAAQRLHMQLNKVPPSKLFMTEALVGDKVLDLCLLLHLRKEGIADPAKLQKQIGHCLSNRALQQNAKFIGVKATGTRSHFDGSLVEQRAFRIFENSGRNLEKTTEKLSPLFK